MQRSGLWLARRAEVPPGSFSLSTESNSTRIALSGAHEVWPRIPSSRFTMKRLWVLIATLGALLLFHGEALASHFRYGTINWVIPNPQAAPNTVEFSVQYAIVAGSPPAIQVITLKF